MKIEAWYSDNFERKIGGRYITNEHIKPVLEHYKNEHVISVLGVSELGKKISIIKIGTGKIKVLAWSQMHGNESTTTKSIFDFIKFITQKETFKDDLKSFYSKYTLCIIPILNPDGALLYTRNNANDVDLNRDACDLTQKESVLLMRVFNDLKPDLCLNLHGQRTIFGLNTNKPATISFLSPSANKARDITKSRKFAMEMIVGMNSYLQKYLPGQIGRYDDSFNSNCFGDAFQMKGVPVILFEAGHFKLDYQREKTREYVFYALLSLFGFVNSTNKENNFNDYFSIPENKKNYNDYILRNVIINNEKVPASIAIQFTEKLEKEKIAFIPKIDKIGELNANFGHKEIDGGGSKILVNSQNNIEIGQIVSIINNKNDKSLIYFDENNFLF